MHNASSDIARTFSFTSLDNAVAFMRKCDDAYIAASRPSHRMTSYLVSTVMTRAKLVDAKRMCAEESGVHCF